MGSLRARAGNKLRLSKANEAGGPQPPLLHGRAVVYLYFERLLEWLQGEKPQAHEESDGIVHASR
jgi:hypothetical protein